MCYLIVYTVFDFPDATTLKTPANGAKFFNELVARTAFRLAGEGDESPGSIWESTLRRSRAAVNVTAVNDQGFDLTFSILTTHWNRLYIAAERSRMHSAENIRAMVSAGEVLYEILHPDYGFGLVAMDSQPIPPPGSGDYSISTLYDFNFLSPRLVTRLGQDRVKSVTASRTHEFSDGGVLLQMSPNPLVEKKTNTAIYEAGMAALGVSRLQQGC